MARSPLWEAMDGTEQASDAKERRYEVFHDVAGLKRELRPGTRAIRRPRPHLPDCESCEYRSGADHRHDYLVTVFRPSPCEYLRLERQACETYGARLWTCPGFSMGNRRGALCDAVTLDS